MVFVKQRFEVTLISIVFLISLNYCYSLLNERNLQDQILNCGDYKCPSTGGKCSGQYSETCVCFPDYDSFPFDTYEMCNYKKKKQLYAFLLETFLMFGVGHFYLENYLHAIIKAIFFALGYFLFILLRTISKKTEENNTLTLVIAFMGCLTCLGMIIWQIIDIVLLGLGKYTDGNDVQLYYMN
jgi:hypothetical protein